MLKLVYLRVRKRHISRALTETSASLRMFIPPSNPQSTTRIKFHQSNLTVLYNHLALRFNQDINDELDHE